MNAIDTRRYEMLVRVRDFGQSYGHLFPESSLARQKFADVAAAVTDLDTHDLTHMTASVSARAHLKAIAREALLRELQAISQTARVLAENMPGLKQQFELPDSESDQATLTAARKFARDVEAFSSPFIAHGMPATFVADLAGLVDDFERASRNRGIGSDTRLAARANIKATMSSGLAAVRSLNVIVANHLRNDEVTTTVWKRDRRVVYPERARSAEATPAAPALVKPATQVA